MKILGNLFGGGAIKAVGKIIDEVFTSEDEKNQAMIAITKIEAELKKRQMDINLADGISIHDDTLCSTQTLQTQIVLLTNCCITQHARN